jgi:MOSC domain-containing protein YiiM
MTPVTLVSVNTGVLERLTPASKSRTGIRKMPVGGAVLCDTVGLVGDAIGNHKHHGGPDQAAVRARAVWRESHHQPLVGCAAGR